MSNWKELKKTEGTWKKVANVLGVHPSTLYRWRKGLSKGFENKDFSIAKGRRQLINVQNNLQKKKSIKNVRTQMDTNRMVYLPRTKEPIGINKAEAQYKRLLKGKVSSERYITFENGKEITTSLQDDIIKYRDKLLKGRLGCKVTVFGILSSNRGKDVPLADIYIRNLLLEDSTWIVNWWNEHNVGMIGSLLPRFKQYAEEKGSYVVENPMVRVDTNTTVVVKYVDMQFSFQ